MTLNQLSYFYQAAVLEHFNQAAEKMNITEPSLSRSIAALEDELGVILFEKRGRNVILTKAGEIFLEHVSTILDDVKRAGTKCTRLQPTADTSISPTYHLWQRCLSQLSCALSSPKRKIKISLSISSRTSPP